MEVLPAVLLVIGILALIEGTVTALFPKYSLKLFKGFARHVEKNIRSWGIAEVIVAIALIVLGLTL